MNVKTECGDRPTGEEVGSSVEMCEWEKICV